MFSRLETIPQKHFIGLRTKLTQKTNTEKSVPLWQKLMPRRNEITNRITSDYYSIQIFETMPNEHFTPNTEFEKWAAIEVSSIKNPLHGLEILTIPSGLYAVFIHKGLPSDFPQTLDYIYSQWIPNSSYSLDHRPHFDVMTEKYSPTNPSSEEEIWVPIKSKKKTSL